MSDDVAEEVDINDPPIPPNGEADDEDIDIPGEDISKAEASTSDWVEPAKDVVFEITHASINKYTPKDSSAWKKLSLKLYLKVDKAGVDGKGKYAGKIFFPNSQGNVGGLLITVNREAYDFTVNAQGKTTHFYDKETGAGFKDYKDFLEALGFPTSPTPNNNKEFRAALIGRKVMGNIEKKNRQVSDGGKFVDVKDEFENNVTKFRAVKVQAAPEAEAAVA